MKKARGLLVVLMIACLLAGCAEMNQTTKASSSPVMDKIIARGELRVGVSGDMPPMNFLAKDDKVIGMDVDLATMIAEVMGVKLNLQRIDFGGLLPALDSGRIDMIVSNMTMTPDRNLKAAFVGPYFTSGKAFLTKRGGITQAKGLPDMDQPAIHLCRPEGVHQRSRDPARARRRRNCWRPAPRTRPSRW